jgi:hypothetical protein
MHKLFVLADPTSFTEVFELTEDFGMHRISQLRSPQESLEFIKNYSQSTTKKVEVTYIGPDDYVRYFANKANNLKNVTASYC